MLGKVHSTEVIAKISKALTGKTPPGGGNC